MSSSVDVLVEMNRRSIRYILNDENEYNANNKYDNYDEDEHADYGTDSSGHGPVMMK